MAEQLTPQQKQAVTDRGGKLLVSAAAGSGKTKVLVDRLMRYLTDPDDPANIDEFLLITFTKAAAAELRGKIASKLSERIAQEPNNRHLQQQLQRLYLTKISTVHSFCSDILREYAYRLNIPGDFRVADENECAELRIQVVTKVLDRAYESAGENGLFRAFVDSQGLGRNDKQVPDIILKVYDSARCHLDPEQWLENCMQISSTENVTDVSQLPYGQFLINALHNWLDLQIRAIDRCAELAEAAEGFESPATLLRDLLSQLRTLRQCETWDEVGANKDISFGTLRFSKPCKDEQLQARIKAVRNHCKKSLEKQIRPFADPSCQVLKDMESCNDATKGLVELVNAFLQDYDSAKRSRRIMDFGDLEHRMLDLLWGKSRSNLTAAAREISERFREIMVDEYQDSNEVQDSIYKALSENKQNLFMVGDVKQSIYQFRLADPSIFLKKYEAYAPADAAEPGQGRKVILSQNFRSSRGVLASANDVFRYCMCPEVGGLYYGDDEALHEGIPHVSLGSAEAELYCVDVQEDTYEEEAAFVADKIQRMLKEGTPVRSGDTLRPVKPEDIVILMVAPGPCGGYFQRALERVGIRCNSGGGVDLLQTEEIASLRCLLQTIYNPRLDIPLIGALASPIFGFTADDLAQIRSHNVICSFYEALQRSENHKAKDFLSVLRQLRVAARKQGVTGLLEEIWFRTGMDDVYGAMNGGDARRDNLQTFFQLASDFEAAGNRELGRFLEYLDNMEAKGLRTDGNASGSGAVTIMSIHKSKGLEFPVVFLCCLSREFNTESQRSAVLCHKDLGLGLYAVDNQKRIRYASVAKRAIGAQIGAETISEQMRVLYVAMTRPKDRLIMTYASNRLEKDLTDIVDRLDLSEKEMLIREAKCPGDWVLLTALQRVEAGELFTLCGRPDSVSLKEPLWNIRLVKAPELVDRQQEASQTENMPDDLEDRLRQGLSFRYRYSGATETPSKQTATQLKGRAKDQEAAENAQELSKSVRFWRKPGFIEEVSYGKEFGNAIHAVMQYIDYAACREEMGVAEEIGRLVSQRYISPRQGEMVDCSAISAFFRTEIGRMLCDGVESVREFKFSILEDGARFDPSLSGEQVLLQGVVDCALIQEDGLTVIDFKTDRVTEETVSAVAKGYRPQVEAYADAMERIYQKRVKRKLLYFFRLNRFVEL